MSRADGNVFPSIAKESACHLFLSVSCILIHNSRCGLLNKHKILALGSLDRKFQKDLTLSSNSCRLVIERRHQAFSAWSGKKKRKKQKQQIKVARRQDHLDGIKDLGLMLELSYSEYLKVSIIAASPPLTSVYSLNVPGFRHRMNLRCRE